MNEINKETTCPFLLRVFYKYNRHNSIHVYQQSLKYSANNYKNDSLYKYPNQQLQLYTWHDISLRQLSDIIINNIDIRNNMIQDVTISFCLVCLDRNGNYTIRNIGKLNANEESSEDTKKLSDIQFTIGDFLDVAIYNNRRDNN